MSDENNTKYGDKSVKQTEDKRLVQPTSPQAVHKMLSSTVVAQEVTTSLISKKLAALRATLKDEHTDEPVCYVSQEDIELGRDTTALDRFIEDIIENRL